MVEKRKAIEILEQLRDRVLILNHPPGSASPEFVTWRNDLAAAVRNIFPNQPAYWNRIGCIVFQASAYGSVCPGADEQTFRTGVGKAAAILQSMAGEIRTYWHENGTASNPEGKKSASCANSITEAQALDPRVVFVVHGRNEMARISLFDFLRRIGLKPLEWTQAVKATGEPAPYIGQILDTAFSKAQAVVVLMTPDDEAYLRQEFLKDQDAEFERNPTGQARPNVLFEAGMAMGRDAKRTVLVEVGALRPFSDIAGRYVLRLDDSLAKRQELAEQLKAAGCEVDTTGTDWHTAGSFEL